MPQYKTVDTDAMLKAADSGQEGIRQAEARRQQESQFTREHALRTGESVARGIQQQEQINEQERSNKAREGLQGQELKEVARRNRMQEAIEQDRQDIEIADKELSSSGQSRADALNKQNSGERPAGARMAEEFREEEMAGLERESAASFGREPSNAQDEAEKARFNEQADQPLEVADPNKRTLAPTQLRQDREASKTVTNRLNAQANYMNARRNFDEAKMKGDEEGMKAEAKSLEQPIKDAANLFDAGKKREIQPNQWENIKSLAEGNPDQQLQQEIATKQFGPALSRFLQNRVSHTAMQYMAATGNMPDGDLVDMASPMMQQFTANAQELQGYIKDADEITGGLMSYSLKVDSLAKRNNLVRKLTADAMLKEMSKPKPSGGSLIPSQGGKAMNPQGAQNAGQPATGPQFLRNRPPKPGAGTGPSPLDADAQRAKDEWSRGK